MTEPVLFVIPLSNVPQTFDIALGGKALTITSRWNDFCGWVLDIFDEVDTVPLVCALPLVTGTNILKQFDFLRIPGQLWIITDGDAYAVPTQQNLGIASFLYYVQESAA